MPETASTGETARAGRIEKSEPTMSLREDGSLRDDGSLQAGGSSPEGGSEPAGTADDERALDAGDDRFLIGRQPIFDDALEVQGFELLFRTPTGLRADGEAMTADVLVRAGLDLGLDRLVGDKLAFVNAGRAFLVGEQEVPLPPGRTVIEVLEDVVHDDDLIAGCRRLRGEGFTIALDDYEWRPGDERLLELASLVKLDMLAMEPERLAEQVERCTAFGARLVAEKIETREQFETCREHGFDLFQGYLLSRPVVLAGRALNPGRLNCLRLVSRLCDPETAPAEVQEIIESDPGLSLRFLRAAGLGAVGAMGRAVRSIREGAVWLGQRRLRSWATLMLLSEAGEGVPDQLAITMTRARLAELVARSVAPDMADSAYTVGLVSALDLHLGSPLDVIVAELPLAQDLVDALLAHQGPLGAILADVLDWEVGHPPLLRSGVTAGEMRELCAQALLWADQLCAPLAAARTGSSGRARVTSGNRRLRPGPSAGSAAGS